MTGLLDCIIETISTNGSICTLDYLLDLGVSEHHDVVILDIVRNTADKL